MTHDRHSSAELAAVEAAATAQDEPPLPLPPPAGGESATVTSGAAWTVAGFAAMQVLRFGINLWLTRLVEKTVFGVMNLVNTFIQGLHMFSDLGIRQCVINSPRGDDQRFLDTAWTVQVLRGVILWVVSLAVCWPLAWLYDTPALLWLVPLAGLTAVCDGLTSTATMTAARQLRRGQLVIRELTAYAVSMGFVITWLLLLRRQEGVRPEQQMLAFAIGNVFSGIIELSLSYTLIRGVRNRFAWDRVAAGELVTYGSWIFVSTACTYLAGNLDRLCVGQQLEELADYHIAAMLARMPTLLVMSLGHQWAFPLFGRLLRANRPIAEVYPAVHQAISGFAGYVVAGAFAVCPTLVLLVYPAAYRTAGDYVRWLSIAAWFTVLQTSSEVVLLAWGETRRVAGGQFIKLLLLGPLLLGGYRLAGVMGVIAGYTLAEAARYVVLASALADRGLPTLKLDSVLSGLVAATAGITTLVGPSMGSAGLGWRFVGETALLTTLWAGVLWYWWRRRGGQIRTLILNTR